MINIILDGDSCWKETRIITITCKDNDDWWSCWFETRPHRPHSTHFHQQGARIRPSSPPMMKPCQSWWGFSTRRSFVDSVCYEPPFWRERRYYQLFKQCNLATSPSLVCFFKLCFNTMSVGCLSFEILSINMRWGKGAPSVKFRLSFTSPRRICVPFSLHTTELYPMLEGIHIILEMDTVY